MKIFNLVKKIYGTDCEVYIDTYMVEDYVKEPIIALRTAVKEFLETDDGKKAIEETCNDFNWGDVPQYVPNNILQKHGLAFASNYIGTEVNHDEVLI